MKITLARSDGFGGIKLADRTLETTDPRIESLVAKALAEPKSSGKTIPDAYSYVLTIESADGTKKLTGQDGALSDEFQELIDLVVA